MSLQTQIEALEGLKWEYPSHEGDNDLAAGARFHDAIVDTCIEKLKELGELGVRESMQRWIDHHNIRADKAEQDVKELVDGLVAARGELAAIEIETESTGVHGCRADDYKLCKWARNGIKAIDAALAKHQGGSDDKEAKCEF